MNRSFILFFSLLLFFTQALSQQPVQNLEELTYALEVKQLDEFIERFNFEEETLVLEYIRENFPSQEISRAELIKTLFNLEKTNWDEANVQAFINEVVDENYPQQLDFFEDCWYAELNCNILHKGKKEIITIVMQIEKTPNNASKWIIRGVQADFFDLPREEDKSKTLNPASHGTDFLGLSKALKDTPNIKNYLHKQYEPDHMSLFINGIMRGEIEFKQVNRISYHFLQIDGWAFTLEQFLRDNGNSGWLIDHLEPIEEKNKYLSEVLHLSSVE